MILAILLALVTISWPPTAQDRCGGPELMGYYEMTSYLGTMKVDPACPLDEQARPQSCARWEKTVSLSMNPSFTLDDTVAVGQVFYIADPVAVDAAGNRSDSPHLPGECSQ